MATKLGNNTAPANKKVSNLQTHDKQIFAKKTNIYALVPSEIAKAVYDMIGDVSKEGMDKWATSALAYPQERK